MSSKPDLTCDVCQNEPAVGVAAVPGVPCSVAYGRQCIQANAHPYGLLVANTACIGGLDQADDWWRGMVIDTCAHLGKTPEQFEADVATVLADMLADEARAADGDVG